MSDNPNLQPCPDCGREVSVRAVACPNCGAPIAAIKAKDPNKEPLWLSILGCLFFVVMIGGCGLIALSSWSGGATHHDVSQAGKYVHNTGGQAYTVIQQGKFDDTTGTPRVGVKLRGDDGTEYWVERNAFDIFYRKQ